ncbi:aspartic peptidase domain-containing protein [Phyllosticta citribraziliensis]|uniref:Aspartic peptidase domain-containing protein n=1 Tax=Phyllosticta citribraziliensis TaxID=989973 RepID=A0ABR1M171_9PEZI
MHSTATLFAILAAVATVAHAADAPQPKVVGLPFTRTKKDVSQLPPLARREAVQLGLQNERWGYNVNVSVGTPPRSFQLHLDTGSSDTWLPDRLSNECKRTGCKYGVFEKKLSSTFEELSTRGEFETLYEDGAGVTGIYFSDTLNMGGLNITKLTMGLGINFTGTRMTPDTEGGIMGIGYEALEVSARKDPSNTYPNVPKQLLERGHISSLAYSLWLNDDDAKFGNILFGGVDTEKFQGDLISVPIVRSRDTGLYDRFTVALSGLAVTEKSGKKVYDQQDLTVPASLDSGSTITSLPDDLATRILHGVGAFNPENGNVWLVPCALGSQGASMKFSFGGTNGPTIAVPFEDLVIPFASLPNVAPQLKEPKKVPICKLGIDRAGNGPVILGDTFLRSAYVVYDLHKNIIALAPTKPYANDSHVEEITNLSIPGVTATAKGVDVASYSPPVNTSYTSALPTFEFGMAAQKEIYAVVGLATGQLPPQLPLQLIMSGFAIIVAGLFGGSLMVLW